MIQPVGIPTNICVRIHISARKQALIHTHIHKISHLHARTHSHNTYARTHAHTCLSVPFAQPCNLLQGVRIFLYLWHYSHSLTTHSRSSILSTYPSAICLSSLTILVLHISVYLSTVYQLLICLSIPISSLHSPLQCHLSTLTSIFHSSISLSLCHYQFHHHHCQHHPLHSTCHHCHTLLPSTPHLLPEFHSMFILLPSPLHSDTTSPFYHHFSTTLPLTYSASPLLSDTSLHSTIISPLSLCQAPVSYLWVASWH